MSASLTSFDITATPTLQAVTTADEQLLVSDLQSRVDEAITQAEQHPEVAEALAAQLEAETELKRLQTASHSLNAQARELRAQVAQATGKAISKLIGAASAAARPDYAPVTQLLTIEHRERVTGRAIERVVEHLSPLALIGRLRADAHAYLTRAKAIEAAAQQRAERILGQLREAVSDEVVLPVDFSKGVAGALLTHASELRRLAGEASKNAHEIERSYLDRNGKE
jgi:hypothetical protein